MKFQRLAQRTLSMFFVTSLTLLISGFATAAKLAEPAENLIGSYEGYQPITKAKVWTMITSAGAEDTFLVVVVNKRTQQTQVFLGETIDASRLGLKVLGTADGNTGLALSQTPVGILTINKLGRDTDILISPQAGFDRTLPETRLDCKSRSLVWLNAPSRGQYQGPKREMQVTVSPATSSDFLVNARNLTPVGLSGDFSMGQELINLYVLRAITFGANLEKSESESISALAIPVSLNGCIQLLLIRTNQSAITQTMFLELKD